MCDYSLEQLNSRPAKLGEKLRTYHFRTCTTGFAAPEDADMAVCVLPGTELAFATPVVRYRLGWLGWRKNIIAHTTALSREVNEDKIYAHHDALEFPDGTIVLLADIVEGQEATVLQLPAQHATAAEVKAQESVPHDG